MGKFFSALYRIYAWVWNHFWGTLLIFGGVVGLMHPGEFPWYVPFCAIAAGIYFYWSPAWSKAAKKTANMALAQTPLEDEAGAVAAIETTLGIKSQATEIKQVIAEPLVMASAASISEVESALDAIVNAKKGAPGFGAVLYELERTEGKITYAMGNQFYPQQFVVQVGLCERDEMTEVAITVLSVRMKDGRYVAANPMMMLRESVICAVDAASDPVKMAEAVKFYGPPEPGSPRAIADRNKKIMLWCGAVL
ncbi:MAG: hypothetical protein Q8K89_05625, partial [Actinomycetota bacterium]|nr:hypothetical protein [Actinomycetota bacterium]